MVMPITTVPAACVRKAHVWNTILFYRAGSEEVQDLLCRHRWQICVDRHTTRSGKESSGVCKGSPSMPLSKSEALNFDKVLTEYVKCYAISWWNVSVGLLRAAVHLSGFFLFPASQWGERLASQCPSFGANLAMFAAKESYNTFVLAQFKIVF